MPVPKSQYLSNAWKDGIFAGRVAFVTGGAGSICSAQTRALVALGANAAIIGRNVEKTERMAADIATARPGAKVIGIGGCDVRDPQALINAAKRCAEELGSIDFVIAGAAGNFVAPIAGLSSNAFRTVMEIDVMGTYNTVKATIPYLVESAKRNPNPPTGDGVATGGRIIAVSAAFHYTGSPLQAHVMAAKASVDNIMVSVALEYGPFGVTANVVTPGAIEGTEGMERLSSSKITPQQMGRSIPSGRMGTTRDIADATVYLFSDAGNYVNGNILVVDGAAWRANNSTVGLDVGMKYPDYLLDGKFSPHVKSGRKEKPKL